MPGDRVVCCDSRGRLTINGTALDKSAYLFGGEEGQGKAASDIPFSVVVPSGRIFVLGDRRELSADSRCHFSDQPDDAAGPDHSAFVPLDKVVGSAVAIAAPRDRARRLRVPSVYDDLAAPSTTPPAVGLVNSPGVTCW